MELAHTLPVLRDEHGRGLVIGSLCWPSQCWQMPPTQPATLELHDAAGDLLARQQIWVMNYADPEVQEVTLYWVQGNNVWPTLHHIPRSPEPARAALEALLWGPPLGNPSGFSTALPTPEQVLAAPEREADWGARVTLRSVTIAGDLATADFSQELVAYRGDWQRASLAREQIAHTLKAIVEISRVKILIEGLPDAVLDVS